MPGTTTLGVSTAVLDQLKSTGQAQIALVYDTAGSTMNGVLQMIEATRVPLILEGDQQTVPAIHARGTFGRDGSPPTATSTSSTTATTPS